MKSLPYYLILSLSLTILSLAAQGSAVRISTTGTGQTTGHIANLSITNNSDQPVNLASGWFFIPATDRYQSYVGYIPPGITIAPGQTVPVPVQGYCTNVHTPPVPYGVSMTDFKDWVLVSDTPSAAPTSSEPTVPEPMNPPGGSTTMETRLVPNRVVPAFSPDDIPGIINSPAYRGTTEETEQSTGGITITYPGTTIPINAVIDFDKAPEYCAPLVVDIVMQIQDAVTIIQNDPTVTTPFSNAPLREREALIQQTIWIVTSALTEDEYTIEDFTENTYRQFTQATGTTVTALDKEDREELDSGVTDFWNAFTAVGIEAKVLSVQGEGSNTQPNSPDSESVESVVVEAETAADCQCDKISFDFGQVAYTDKGPDGTVGTPGIKFPVAKSYPIDGEEAIITLETTESRNRFSFSIQNIEISCSCLTDEACPTVNGPYLDLGEGKGTDPIARAAKETLEKAAAEAEETIDEVKEAVEAASTKAKEAASDKQGNSSGQGKAVAIADQESVELTSIDGKHSIFIKLPKGQEKTIQFTISGTCGSDNCGTSACKKVFIINIKRP